MKVAIGILGLIYKCYIAVIFSVTLLLFYLPILLLKQKESTKKKTFFVFTIWSWTFRILAFIYVKFENKEETPSEPHIIVSNHGSYFDIFLMYSMFPKHPFLFLGKSEILSYPLMRTYFKKLNIPVFRNNRLKAAKSFIESKNALKNGWSLVIFPEGGIPDENLPSMIEFKDGAFKLAKSNLVPIVPITFINNYKLFSDPGKIFGPASPGISKVYQHKTISVEQIAKFTEEELKNYCFSIISSKIR